MFLEVMREFVVCRYPSDAVEYILGEQIEQQGLEVRVPDLVGRRRNVIGVADGFREDRTGALQSAIF